MSRLGLHVTTGSRNGYGYVVENSPGIVVSTEGGALVEAKTKSDGETWTIYRETKFYADNPGLGLDDPATTEEEARGVADMFYPLLRAEWELNPADYYIVINESGANNPETIKNYIAYETRMMELAEADGYKLCLGNLFSGAPDDGSVAGGPPNGGIETWKELYGPMLRRAMQGGHIYGRHVYGYPDLSPFDFNSNRAFREAAWMYSNGIHIGVAVTECGLDGGQGPVDSARLIDQVSAFDDVILGDPIMNRMIVGFAWWTYGDFTGAGGQANIQGHSPAIAEYLADNISQPWQPIDYIPQPPPREPNTIKHTIHILPQDTTEEELGLVTRALHSTRSAFTYSHDVVEAVMFHSTPEGTIVAWEPERWDFNLEEYLSWLDVNWQVRYFEELEEPSEPSTFAYEFWPVRGIPFVTQRWAANPDYYAQFGLPGHEGVDIRAPQGSVLQAVAAGEVVRVHLNPDDHNYGIHVYIQHRDNELTGYGHMARTNLFVGDTVEAGEQIGFSGNTGNSSGPHLHFLRKRPGETYTDEHGTWPYDIHDPTELLYAVAPEAFDTPPSKTYDIYGAMTTGATRGPLYEVRTEVMDDNGKWQPGPQERHQTHEESGKFYHTKGGDGEHKHAHWEELKADATRIYRNIDTSPDEDHFYQLQDSPPADWSVWCPRYMYVGQTFQRNPLVTFHAKLTCEIVSNGWQPSLIKLEAVHEELTFFTGITLSNVVQLAWLDMEGRVLERYYYANGYGLVGWGYGTTRRRAAISEVHAPGARPNNIREAICL